MKKKSKRSKNSVDLISNLPDPILHLILSRLPTTEEAVRTSILSTPWRYLWTSLPSIDLDCTRASTNFNMNTFKDFVSSVLENQTLDLESVRLHCANYYKKSTVLKLFLYKRPLVFPFVTGGFPALRVLELNSVRSLDRDLVHRFLDRCPLLEDLTLVGCFSFSTKMDDDYSDSDSDSDDDDDEEEEEDYDEFYKIRGLCERLKISCPKLAFLEYVGQPAYEVICENLDALKKSMVYPDAMAQKGRSFKSFGDSICQLFAGISHVESLSLNHSFIRAINAARDLNGNFPASLGEETWIGSLPIVDKEKTLRPSPMQGKKKSP
ncbi:F-box/LRR-repeat protein At2g29930-like [Bidens hawaiensis]|uniref:F-box/LRR-repeat protein At2g29930-like n=1 Tax=Bidens hawaiensis TaxID=980011 RepID=UPI00404AF2C5